MASPRDVVNFRLRNDREFNAVQTSFLRVGDTQITGTASIPDTLSSATAGEGAITIEATDPTGGIDVDAGTAGIDVDTGGPVAVTTTDTTATAVQVSATGGGIDINAGSDGLDISTNGPIIMDGDRLVANTANDVTLVSLGGDVEVDGSAINLTSTSTAANALRLRSLGGGVQVQTGGSSALDMNAGTGGVDVDTTGQISLTSEGMQFLVAGAATGGGVSANAGTAGINVDTTGQISLDSSQAASNAIEIVSSDTAGGIDVSAGTGGILIDTTGGMTLSSSNQVSFSAGTGGISFPKATITQLTSLTTGVTVNSTAGVITTVPATLASNATASFVVTNNRVAATSVVVAGVQAYSGTFGTNGIPTAAVSAVAAGSFTVTLANSHGTAALNGAVGISFLVL